MIITIGGMPGSGKTSVARLLSERLHRPCYSMGGLRAKMAMERGLSIDELNAVGENDPQTDAAVDEYQKHLGETEDDFIMEGRLSWHFIPRSFKIFLECDTAEAARRIFAARKATREREDEPVYNSWQETQAAIEARIASDRRRYQTHYGLDHLDRSHYDLVIDTTPNSGPQQTLEKIVSELAARDLIK